MTRNRSLAGLSARPPDHAHPESAQTFGLDPGDPPPVEQVLFADDSVIDDFVERFARPNLAAIDSLLDDGLGSGILRRVDSRFLVPFMFGSFLFLFLHAPVLRRLHDIDEIDPDLAREYADQFAALVMHGIAAPRGASS